MYAASMCGNFATHKTKIVMYTERIEVNMIKGTLILGLFLLLNIYSFMAAAQTSIDVESSGDQYAQKRSRSVYGFFKGVGASFQTRVFTLKSDIPELNGLSVLQEGGQAGLFAGNRFIRARLGLLGLMYSSMRTPRTINVFEVEGGVNYYFLQASKRIRFAEPYLTTGLVYDILRFRGHYLGSEGMGNTSVPEPYLGSIRKMDATIGAGLELGLLNAQQFVHLFTEAKYGVNLSQSASNRAFENTSVSNQVMISMGLRFGTLR